MKIGIALQHFDPRGGGAEHWTWQYVEALRAAGHELHMIAESFSSAVGQLGIQAHTVPRTRSRTEFADASADLLSRLPLDVIHDMGHGWYCDVFQPHGGSRRAAFRQNLLMLPPWLRPWKRAVTRLLPRYREFDRLLARQYAADGRQFIALSQMVARDMQHYHAVPPDRLHLIYNGVNVERFHPEACRPHRAVTRQKLGVRDEVLLLIVANSLLLKGVPALLRATARLRREGQAIRLAVVGKKGMRPCQRLARRLGVDSDVTFLGLQTNVVPLYAAADVYVHPTFYDPCSLVVLEAMACGLPVITSRFNGVSELMRPGEQGFVLDDPADDATLTEQIRPLLDPDERIRMGRAAWLTAEAHSWERNCREMMAVYEHVAGRRRRAA